MRIPMISVTLATFCEINTKVVKAIQCIARTNDKGLDVNATESIELLLQVSSLCNSCTSGMVAKEKLDNEMLNMGKSDN